MSLWTKHLKGALSRLRGRNRAIIVGAGHAEYAIYQQFQRTKEYEVLFFIDDDPWNHRTRIGDAELRYPVELQSLIQNYNIDAVVYCDEKLLQNAPAVRCRIIDMSC